MRQRPTHLEGRQVGGDAFGEPVRLYFPTSTRQAYGRFEETDGPPTDTLCATQPGTTLAAGRQRELMEGGVQLNAARVFYLAERLEPVTADGPGSILLYPVEVNDDGTVDTTAAARWRARSVEPWGGFFEVVAIRQEGQGYAENPG